MKINELSKEQILAAVNIIDGDGHTIFKPEAFVKAGWPQELVDQYTETIESNFDDPKETIISNGKTVKQLKGIYGLSLLHRITSAIGTEGTSKLGRGFQARQLTENIKAHFA
jgi:hypothetical protein